MSVSLFANTVVVAMVPKMVGVAMLLLLHVGVGRMAKGQMTEPIAVYKKEPVTYQLIPFTDKRCKAQSSCQDRCGQVFSNEAEFSCSCDEHCRLFGDCCQDVTDACPGVLPQFIQPHGEVECIKPSSDPVRTSYHELF